MSESENNGRATKVAAFFDVDGTLLVAQSGNLYIRYLYRQGLLSLVDRVRLVWAYLSYRLGFVNFAVVGEFLSRLLKGHSEESLAAQCRDWYATDVRPYFSVAMLACVRQHKERGDVIVLLTGATSYLCDLIAADLGIDHVVCNELELRDGFFTGRAVLPLCYGKGKILRARAFAEDHGIDLSASSYYADSISDLPMLREVGQPFAVNPDPRLRVEAMRRRWPIIDDSSRSLPLLD